MPTHPNARPKADANTPRPDWIRCAGVVFDIEWYPTQPEFKLAMPADSGLKDDDDVMAMTDGTDHIIRMGCWYSLDRQRVHLLHEVMHAIINVTSPDWASTLSEPQAKFASEMNWEEWYLSLLDTPLTNTLRDNPIATKWILGGA